MPADPEASTQIHLHEENDGNYVTINPYTPAQSFNQQAEKINAREIIGTLKTTSIRVLLVLFVIVVCFSTEIALTSLGSTDYKKDTQNITAAITKLTKLFSSYQHLVS